MRIMPLTQQNLNTRPCVQNNQPNFKGLFIRENPLALEKAFPKGSVGAKVLDVIELIINRGANKHLNVTVAPLSEDLAEDIILFRNDVRIGSGRTNVEFKSVVQNPESTETAFPVVIRTYLGEEDTVNSSVSNIMQTFTVDDLAMDWQGIAEALKKG